MGRELLVLGKLWICSLISPRWIEFQFPYNNFLKAPFPSSLYCLYKLLYFPIDPSHHQRRASAWKLVLNCIHLMESRLKVWQVLRSSSNVCGYSGVTKSSDCFPLLFSNPRSHLCVTFLADFGAWNTIRMKVSCTLPLKPPFTTLLFSQQN